MKEEHSIHWIENFRRHPEFWGFRFKKLDKGFNGYPPFDFDNTILDIVDLKTFIKVEKHRIPLFIGTQFGIFPCFNDYPDFFREDKIIAVLGKSRSV